MPGDERRFTRVRSPVAANHARPTLVPNGQVYTPCTLTSWDGRSQARRNSGAPLVEAQVGVENPTELGATRPSSSDSARPE